jgi:hypothetical protein
MARAERWRTVLIRGALVAAALSSSSCFYDSRWFEMKQAQAAAAEHAKPSALRATPEGAAGPQSATVRVFKVRAYATPRYAAEVMRWSEQLSALLDDASQVLEPTLGARLELAGTEPWSPRAGEDDVDAAVQELTSLDPGQDVHWVIGLVGSVPRVELSFHQLGVGRLLGKHIVLRAMNDAREYDAIQAAFTDLDEKQRRDLYHQRKRHKMTTVLLHEIAHTLGVPHERDAKTLMAPIYDAKVEGCSEAAAALMRLSLGHRIRSDAGSEQAAAAALIAQLERTSSSWVPSERDALLARLRSALQPVAPPPSAQAASARTAPAATPPPDPRAVRADDPLSGLGELDRATFAQAVHDRQAGHLSDAWDKAQPLFTGYPGVYAVQELRCQLAMQRGGAWEQVQTHCEPLTKLTDEMLKGAKGK